jgi:hypothetical protein
MNLGKIKKNANLYYFSQKRNNIQTLGNKFYFDNAYKRINRNLNSDSSNGIINQNDSFSFREPIKNTYKFGKVKSIVNSLERKSALHR